MRAALRDGFTTIHTEGGLLPADLLARIASPSPTLAGVTSEAYHLSGQRLSEAINRSWSRLVAAWSAFREASSKLPDNDPGTSVTRERWLLVLFDVLGYAQLGIAALP